LAVVDAAVEDHGRNPPSMTNVFQRVRLEQDQVGQFAALYRPEIIWERRTGPISSSWSEQGKPVSYLPHVPFDASKGGTLADNYAVSLKALPRYPEAVIPGHTTLDGSAATTAFSSGCRTATTRAASALFDTPTIPTLAESTSG